MKPVLKLFKKRIKTRGASRLCGEGRSRKSLTSPGETSHSVSNPEEGRCGFLRTAPFITTAINMPLRTRSDVCPSGCFTADNWMCLCVIWQGLVICSAGCADYIKLSLPSRRPAGVETSSLRVLHVLVHTVQLSAWWELNNASNWIPRSDV